MRFWNVNLLWVLPATGAIAVFWVVSAYANYWFGVSLGSNIFGYASLASDVAKTVILFGVFAAWASGRYVVMLVLAAIWSVCTVWSVFSAVGFMSMHYAETTDKRGKSAESYTLLQNEIKALEADLGKVKTVRPEAVVQAEIDALLQTPGVGGCSTINGPVSARICPQVAALRIELGHAKSGTWLQGRLREARADLKATDRVTTIDPRADTLAAISGQSEKDTQRAFTAFFALMLELITALGLWAIWSAFGGVSTEKPRTAPETIPAVTAPVIVSPPMPAPLPRSELRPNAKVLARMAGVTPVSAETAPTDHGTLSKPETMPDGGNHPTGPGTPMPAIADKDEMPANDDKPVTTEVTNVTPLRPRQETNATYRIETPDDTKNRRERGETKAFIRECLGIDKASLAAMKAAIRDRKPIDSHVADRLMESPDCYELYANWCEENGLAAKSSKSFSGDLWEHLGLQKGTRKLKGVKGIRNAKGMLFPVYDQREQQVRRYA